MWGGEVCNKYNWTVTCLENPMNSMKRQKDMTLKDELPRLEGVHCAIGEEWRSNSRKNEEKEPKWKQYPVVDMTGDGSKVQYYKEQYCIGTWNVRSMNQGKSEVVKQDMARVNIDILEISELQWTGMGKFTSDDHYIYYCGQESLRRNGVALIINKRVRNAVLGCNLKNKRMICSFPRQTIQLHMDITRWSIPKSDWLYSLQPKMEKLHTTSENKTGSWLWLRSWTPYCKIQT